MIFLHRLIKRGVHSQVSKIPRDKSNRGPFLHLGMLPAIHLPPDINGAEASKIKEAGCALARR